MLTVDDARRHILDAITPLDPLELAIAEAHGSVLAEEVCAAEDLPPFPSSALDGYAIRSADTEPAARAPLSLTVIGEAAAGRPFAGRVAVGEAVRIFTGAVIPEGTDAVVGQEDVAVVGSSMAIGKPIARGSAVRPAGEDVRSDEVVLRVGQRLRGVDVGVLAALGRQRVKVHPRVRGVVFSTGDELREPGQPLGPGLIRDSNSYTLVGMMRESGAVPVRTAIVPDSPGALEETIQSYLPQADVFVTSGGVSVGEHDYVKKVLEKLGHVQFWQVAVKPGKPLAFGVIQGRPFFGLPGNPVAVAVTFELFVRPALLKMMGRKTLLRAQIEASLEDGYRQAPGRETYLRVRTWRDERGWHARLVGRQESHIVSALGGTNAFAIVPADRGQISPGERVKLMLLEPLEGW